MCVVPDHHICVSALLFRAVIGRFPRSLTPFVSLPLAMPVTRSPSGSLVVPWGVDLQYCLSRYSQAEVVEGVECLNCSLRATLAAAAAPAATLAADGDTLDNNNFTTAVDHSSRHLGSCAELQPDGDDVQQPQPLAGSDACGTLCAARGLGCTCHNCQWQDSCHQQQLKQKQHSADTGHQQQQQQRQQLLSQLTSLSSLTSPLPPLDYQVLLQQSGIAWLSCRRDVLKATRIARAPRVLVIQLQRSVHSAAGMGKVQGQVKFPLQLDLQEHVLVEQQQQQHDRQSEFDEQVQQHGPEQQEELEASGLHHKQQLQQPHVSETQHKLARQQQCCQLQPAALLAAVNKMQQKVDASSSCTPPAPLVYDCTAVVQHLGAGQASGHYIMYRKVDQSVGCDIAQQPSAEKACAEGSVNGLAAPHCSSGSSQRMSPCWLRVNDSTVCPANEREVLQCHATLLVYERCA